MATLEQNKKRVLAAATKKPLSGSEIAAKLHKKYPSDNYGNTRSISRTLGELARSGALKTQGNSRKTYSKA